MPILDIVVPAEIGNIEECVVVTWLKRQGDTIEKDAVLLILQAEKVSFEVAVPQEGRVTAILAQQGEVVKKGQLLAQLEVEALAPTAPPLTELPAAPSREVIASPVAKRLAREHNLDLSQIPTTGVEKRITEKDVLAFIAAQKTKMEPTPPASEVRASPLAKRLAREHQIDLGQVVASGSDGRISEKDVLAFIEARQSKAMPAPATTPPSAVLEVQAEAIPMSRTRATIARRMHQSLQSMAQLTLHTEADVTELVMLRETLKTTLAVTYTDLIVRACAIALGQHPGLNATLEGESIRLLPQINIGLAVALEDGLIVPVIRQAEQQNLAQLAQTRTRLIERARAGQLTRAEISGGTFTITNLGNYDIDAFTPIVNPPEAAILGIGRIVDKVVIHQSKIAQRAILTLSLTFDHRLVDGAPAAAFLQNIKRLLEAPGQLNL
jgi:pyruvate dehydrogenase E2 component (dihydrolipoamide acetyltransferase)